MELKSLLQKITPADSNAESAARIHWDTLAKPLGSLGRLEDTIVSIAALRGNADVCIDRRALLVFCSDNGVVAQGVTHTGSDVTAAVARSLAAGDSTVCHMANVARCAVLPVDMGILDFPVVDGVRNFRIRNGTGDISQGPAMSRAECQRAILAGTALVKELAEQGIDIIATGEMGIGNTTTSSAVASVLLHQPVEEMTGRGSGLSDAGLQRKIAAIHRAIDVNTPDPSDPVDVLMKVGGLDIAAMCGAFLGGAAYRVPVVVDGFISSVAALCALRMCPDAKKAMVASHVSAEPAGARVLEALGLQPLISAAMRLGEGSGAVAALPLLDMAFAVYHSGHTFENLGIDAYTPQQ